MSKVYVGDIGTIITLDCATDISAASAVAIHARRPDGSAVTWGATLVAPSSIRYIVGPGDIQAAGRWVLQAHVTTPIGVWSGESVAMDVFAAFK